MVARQLALAAVLLILVGQGHGSDSVIGSWQRTPPPPPAAPLALSPHLLGGQPTAAAAATAADADADARGSNLPALHTGSAGRDRALAAVATADAAAEAAFAAASRNRRRSSSNTGLPTAAELWGSAQEQEQRARAATHLWNRLRQQAPFTEQPYAVGTDDEESAVVAAQRAQQQILLQRIRSRRTDNSSIGIKAGAVAAQQRARPKPRRFRIWMLSCMRADYHSPELLRQWLRHYQELGVSPSHILMLVNHNPASPTAAAAAAEGQAGAQLKEAEDVLQAAGVRYRLWLGQYTEQEHYRLQLRLLFDEVRHLDDWVLLAGLEEFQLYITPAVRPFLDSMAHQGYNWVRGFLHDRATESGQLVSVGAPPPSVFQQFPLRCNILGRMGKTRTHKVAAMRAYWRADMGARKLVYPFEAHIYYEIVSAQLPGPPDNLYAYTPYSRYRMRYWYQLYPPENIELGGASAKLLFWPRRANMHALTQRFAWHAGTLPWLRDSVDFYRAAYNESSDSRDGSLRHREFMYLAQELHAVAVGHVDTTKYQCVPKAHNPAYLDKPGQGQQAQQQGVQAQAAQQQVQEGQLSQAKQQQGQVSQQAHQQAQHRGQHRM